MRDILDNIGNDYHFFKSGLNVPLCAYFTSRSVRSAPVFVSFNLKCRGRIGAVGYLLGSVIFSSKLLMYRSCGMHIFTRQYSRCTNWALYPAQQNSDIMLFGGIFVHGITILFPPSRNLQPKSCCCCNLLCSVARFAGGCHSIRHYRSGSWVHQILHLCICRQAIIYREPGTIAV